MPDPARPAMTRRAFLTGAGFALSAGAAAAKGDGAKGEEGGGALSTLLRFFARLLGRSTGAGAGGAAAAAVAASDPRPCKDVHKIIERDRRDLARREREITRKQAELDRMEAQFAAQPAGARPSDALMVARQKQTYRLGWYRKDLGAHRGDVASFNTRCTAGKVQMMPQTSYAPGAILELLERQG